MSSPIHTGALCMRAWEAMPWVSDERAPHSEGDWLRKHLASCSSCRAAFEHQRLLQRALALPADPGVDAQDGLRHLLARIEAPEPQELPVRLASSPGWLTQGLLAAVLIQAVGLAVVAAKVWPPPHAPVYRTLGQEPVPAAAATIRVVPDAAMALTDWNALLHVLKLRVVGGPDAAGAYTVAPLGAAATTRHTLQQLRATRGVKLAEPLHSSP